MKIQYCSHCKTTIGPFMKHSKDKTGEIQYYRCRKCNTGWLKEYRKTKIGKEVTSKASAKSIRKYYGKQFARMKLNYAIRLGQIKKPKKCSKCGGPKPNGHHPDYSKPLEVIWLCRGCHADLHRELKNNETTNN